MSLPNPDEPNRTRPMIIASAKNKTIVVGEGSQRKESTSSAKGEFVLSTGSVCQLKSADVACAPRIFSSSVFDNFPQI